ncbi:MAG: endolytic transglycosylase MltG [Cyclobacteriaceae bacterium]|nr:endolytic transglycosylase MltG [Cyclobacteriaceae bacterium]
MNEISKKKLAIFLVLSMLLITFTFYFYQILFTPNILVEKGDRVFVIKPGTTFRQVQQDLKKGDYVNDLVSFSFLARLYGYDKKVIPGRFILRSRMTNLQAIRILKSGKQEPVKITFNYVRLQNELGERITKNLGMSPQEFDEALARFVATNDEGFTERNVLSMFIPNTYEIYFNITPDDLIARMNKEYHSFWNDERRALASEVGLTPIEVSILASIVQAETVKTEEAPIIAGLYLNRLKKGIALQADPTLVFASGDFSLKRVLNQHKEIDSPYNTYKYAGLPPGPINMPQVGMLEAVLHPEQHGYYYMCAREDFSGYHNFATNLTDHQRNATRYQRALSAELRKAGQKKK